MESQVQDQTTATGASEVTELQSQTQESSAKAPQAPAVEATSSQAEGAAPAYTPNFKYQVQDQEKEFEEWIRPIIKSQDVEKRVRDLYTKLDGFDVLKPKLEKTREELEGLRAEYQPIQGAIAQLRKHVQNEDFDSFFKDLNIPNQMVMQWVAKKLQYENLPPEEKRRYDETLELRRERSRLQEERDQYENRYQSQTAQAKALELDYVLQRPEINQVMRDYDARVGRVGAFRDEVVYHAIAREQATQKAISASDAVQSLLGLMGRSPQAPPSHTANPQEQSQQTISQGAKPPVIPNIKSRGASSPVKKHHKSLDDFKKYADARIKELQG